MSLNLKCFRCGKIADRSAGESWHNGLVWWQHVRCESCGWTQTSDGRGKLSAELRQQEFDKNGAWLLILVDSSKKIQVVKVLGDILKTEHRVTIQLLSRLPLLYEGSAAEIEGISREIIDRLGQNVVEIKRL